MVRWTHCLALLGAVTILGTNPLVAQRGDDQDEGKLRQAEGRRSLALLRAVAAAASGSRDYDVTFYKLDLRIDIDPTRISGSVTLRALSRSDSLSVITLDLLNSMTVDSVVEEGSSRAFVQGPQSLDIDLGHARASGSAFAVSVYYHGIPVTSGFGSFASTTAPNGSPWIWTLSEPYGARDWWPCNDHPSDKADSLDVWITVPGALKAGSQGVLEGVVSNSDGTKTYRWKHRYPISTYLVSLAIADYAQYSYWFKHSPTDSMEVLNYLLPGVGTGSLPLTVDMLQIFSELFGPYPFLAEKYGHAQFGWGGAMEHQTMTSTGSTGEGIIAHELAHQWFGDMITLETWPHMWLNEGFATYGEILYRERKYGWAAYQSAMAYRMGSAMTATTSLYVTDTTNMSLLFSDALVYSKGSVVLHMLRHVVGDAVFFQALRAYASDPGVVYGTATTEDFRSVVEGIAGRDLGAFFTEWVYGERYPRYTCTWGSAPQGGAYLVVIELSQSTGTPNPPFFTMPLELKIVGLEADTTIVLLNDQPTQTFSATVPFNPTNVVVDPNNWVLKTATDIRVALKDGHLVPADYELGQNFPNPFNASTTISFSLGARSHVVLDIYDVLGRRIATVVDGIRDAGFYAEQWTADVPTGTYVVRLQASAVDGSSTAFIQSKAMMVIR